MSIGEMIKSLRLARNLSRRALTELTGIPEITVRQYEAGEYIPKIDKIYKMADALDVSPCVICKSAYSRTERCVKT